MSTLYPRRQLSPRYVWRAALRLETVWTDVFMCSMNKLQKFRQVRHFPKVTGNRIGAVAEILTLQVNRLPQMCLIRFLFFSRKEYSAPPKNAQREHQCTFSSRGGAEGTTISVCPSVRIRMKWRRRIRRSCLVRLLSLERCTNLKP